MWPAAESSIAVVQKPLEPLTQMASDSMHVPELPRHSTRAGKVAEVVFAGRSAARCELAGVDFSGSGVDILCLPV